MNILAVGAGGFAGAVLRYMIGKIPFPAWTFPAATFAANVLGAVIIGIVFALSAKLGGSDSAAVLFLKTGFCGGLTTFSTFSLEGMTLIQSGHTGLFLIYAAASVTVCLLAAAAGNAIGNMTI